MKIISKTICDEVKQKLKENLNEFWYHSYSPKSYNRTMDLIESITGVIERKGRCDYSIKVYFDPNKIYAVKNDMNWNAHMGFNNEAFTDGLISSIEHGMKGSYLNPRRGDAAHMIEFTQDWANQYAKQLLKTFI